MKLFSGLIDAAPTVPTDGSDELQVLRSGPSGVAIGSLLVTDRELLALDRATSAELPVTVINTSGAGGLTALAGRSPERLRVVAVDNAVRDLVDPVGNIARVASAARELDPAIIIRVQIPYGCNAYDQAVAEAEAEGMQALLSITDSPGEVAVQLSALVEADLPFAASLDRPPQLIGLLVALDALIDDAPVADAERLLTIDDPAVAVATIAGWDDQHLGRLRRRLTAVRVADPAGLVDHLIRWQLLDAPT